MKINIPLLSVKKILVQFQDLRMKIIVVLVLLRGYLCLEDSSTSQPHLQEEVCSILHKEMGSSSYTREFTGLLAISVKFMEMDLSNLPPHYLGGYFRNLVLPQPPHTRRRKRSYILPPTHNMHNTQNTDCVKKYRVDVSQIFQKYPSWSTLLNQGETISVFGSDLLQINENFLVTVQYVKGGQCAGEWKILSARKWDDLSAYQRDLLNDGTYLQNCGSNTEVLQECFKPPANRKSSLDRYASCSDKFSYCALAGKTPARLEKKNREFNSCVNEVKVTTPKPLVQPVA
uniref:Uncharacterized protein n=1 Tax=Magallana gigas TaxID=29159 RepID=A0A8W8M6K6_MAGGI